ncbi:conjugal transfer protein TraD [Rhizobium sp. CCGE 510]|uniref:conjugal transfer protein TraD n=1 Tax=Rhizobium sp. CCGE 510 TaxID=1132836 RepID=UPI00027B895D|nr:conjugal transfer protein TraD [Rhizobium sp. CCGE 510]EJT01390.1 conjugal transfer protein D [Rhizobium sp. CCGE 510]
MTAERKRDTREKILLGGIVSKAGLSKADRAFLLGGLMEMARLVPGSIEHRRLGYIGKEAFKAPSLTNGSSHLEEKERWA